MKFIKNFLIWSFKWTFELIPIIVIIWIITIILRRAHDIWQFITQITFLNKLLPSHETIDSIISLLSFMIIAYIIHNITKRWIWAFIRKKFDNLLKKFPIFGKLYKTSKNVVNVLKENNEQNKPNIIWLIKYDVSYSIGFIVYKKDLIESELVPVFIPAPPIPTSWNLNLMEKDRILVMDTTWEDAASYILSLGVDVSNSINLSLKDIKKLPTLTKYLEKIESNEIKN